VCGRARQMLMDEYDIDGSGRIEFSEFESMVRLGKYLVVALRVCIY